jgi:hypothetical protein
VFIAFQSERLTSITQTTTNADKDTGKKEVFTPSRGK